MASGGFRPGSGAKKGQHRIAHHELRVALEKELGIPYVEMLAQTQLKLFNDFKNDINVREYIRFTENMSNRILEPVVQEISMSSTSEMSVEDLRARAAALLAKVSEQNNNTSDVQDGDTQS